VNQNCQQSGWNNTLHIIIRPQIVGNSHDSSQWTELKTFSSNRCIRANNRIAESPSDEAMEHHYTVNRMSKEGSSAEESSSTRKIAQSGQSAMQQPTGFDVLFGRGKVCPRFAVRKNLYLRLITHPIVLLLAAVPRPSWKSALAPHRQCLQRKLLQRPKTRKDRDRRGSSQNNKD
jgi:hypothetical protein